MNSLPTFVYYPIFPTFFYSFFTLIRRHFSTIIIFIPLFIWQKFIYLCSMHIWFLPDDLFWLLFSFLIMLFFFCFYISFLKFFKFFFFIFFIFYFFFLFFFFNLDLVLSKLKNKKNLFMNMRDIIGKLYKYILCH